MATDRHCLVWGERLVKVTTERLPKSLIALDIELDQQQVEKGLDRAARKLSQQYRIPGFRPGKAPRFIVENYVGRARLMEEASDDLINKSFQDALKQEQITPVGRANLDDDEDDDAEQASDAAFVDEVDHEDEVELDTDEEDSETAFVGEADHEDEAE